MYQLCVQSLTRDLPSQPNLLSSNISRSSMILFTSVGRKIKSPSVQKRSRARADQLARAIKHQRTTVKFHDRQVSFGRRRLHLWSGHNSVSSKDQAKWAGPLFTLPFKTSTMCKMWVWPVGRNERSKYTMDLRMLTAKLLLQKFENAQLLKLRKMNYTKEKHLLSEF